MREIEEFMGKTFTSANDISIAQLIRKAKKRLVFIGPGLRLPVVEALKDAMNVVPRNGFQIILDVDPEVCRLGYGDIEALELVRKSASQSGIEIRHQPGIRIGLIISDNSTMIYSPTPELIEAGNSGGDKPNAIVLDDPPEDIDNACGGGDESSEPEIGGEPVSNEIFEETKKDLEDNPPKPFDVARAERVFNSKLHFVEFEISHYKLSRGKLDIDAKLLGVMDSQVVERLTSKYDIFGRNSDRLETTIPYVDGDGNVDSSQDPIPFHENDFDAERRRFKETYLIPAGRWGQLILRKNKNDFDKEIKILKKKAELYRDEIKEVLREQLDELVDELFSSLKDFLMKNPPKHWKNKRLGGALSESDARRLFGNDVGKSVDQIIRTFNPTISVIFKDVTYETFKDENFKKLLEVQFGEESVKEIFSEYDAAPETSGKS